jgi:hypothetical protein
MQAVLMILETLDYAERFRLAAVYYRLGHTPAHFYLHVEVQGVQQKLLQNNYFSEATQQFFHLDILYRLIRLGKVFFTELDGLKVFQRKAYGAKVDQMCRVVVAGKDLYTKIGNKSRQAALCTVWIAQKHFGTGKDIARNLGTRVFEMRNELEEYFKAEMIAAIMLVRKGKKYKRNAV